VDVVLECGHTIRMRDHPWREDAKFGCKMGLSCGYRLWWVSWVDKEFGTHKENLLYLKSKE
jgi:hypothetical protein